MDYIVTADGKLVMVANCPNCGQTVLVPYRKSGSTGDKGWLDCNYCNRRYQVQLSVRMKEVKHDY